MREGGGTVENTLKEGGTEKRGGDTKILKRAQGVGALKREAGTVLRTNPMFITAFVQLQPEGSNKKDVNASFTFKCTYLHLTQIPASAMNSFIYHGHN